MSDTLLTKMLDEVGRLESCRIEPTLLSIGGRGYYENPTSDLLKFFLEPGNAHGLGSLFIDAFLAAAGLESESLSLASLSVEREEPTDDQKRIDLFIRGEGWIMLVENKIWHHENNPFESYNRLARQKADGGLVFKCILAPAGNHAPEGWLRITYASLLDELEPRLAGHSETKKTDKWWHFASDFTLHFRNELYARTMNEDALDFAEQYFPQMQQAIELNRQYREHLLRRMGEVASGCVGHDRFRLKDEGWGLRIYFHEWNDANVVWWHDDKEGYALKGSVYILSASEEERRSLRAVIEEFGFGKSEWVEGSWFVVCTTKPFTNIDHAEGMVKKSIEKLLAFNQS